jgi:hypothetical protein
LPGTWSFLAITAALALLGPAARATDHPLDIRSVVDVSWGGRTQDVEKVLHSAAEELWPYFPGRTLKPILVEPKGGPITLFRHGPNGEYLVRLNTGNRLWAQHAYQFAHEFGHILANYDEHERGNKWFEESVCEMASLFVLRRMSETWKVRPPYPNWRDYAPALSEYADERIRTARLPPGKKLAQWYRENQPLLQQEPCQRDKNTVVAAAQLPRFEKQPENWEAIGWLNDGTLHGTRTFARYLEDWHARVPPKHRPIVRQVAEEFGLEIEDETGVPRQSRDASLGHR